MFKRLQYIAICLAVACTAPTASLAESGASHGFAIGYPKPKPGAMNVQRRAREIRTIYEFISGKECDQTKAFAVGLVSRNGPLARGVKAGKGI